jgi:hypothetical protein
MEWERGLVGMAQPFVRAVRASGKWERTCRKREQMICAAADAALSAHHPPRRRPRPRLGRIGAVTAFLRSCGSSATVGGSATQLSGNVAKRDCGLVGAPGVGLRLRGPEYYQ